MLCFTSPTRKRLASAPSRLTARMIASCAALMSDIHPRTQNGICRDMLEAAAVGEPSTLSSNRRANCS